MNYWSVTAVVVTWTLSPLLYVQSRTTCKPSNSSVRYAIVIDAGSSGSRIRVYEWVERENGDNKLPNFTETYSFEKNPGVSDCKTKDEIGNYTHELVNKAAGYVPKDSHSNSSIYFMATAGMRMMLEAAANDATRYIDRKLRDKKFNPFRYESSYNELVLSGEEEGLFAWIAANYLAKKFDNYGTRNMSTIGVLELGGASTQIAFVPRGNIFANKVIVHLAGATYNLYVHSYLEYGQDRVDRWIKEKLYNNSLPLPANRIINHPCMLRGDYNDTTYKFLKVNVTFVGTGEPQKCVELLHELIYKPSQDRRCNPKPCAIGTVYQPTIQPDQIFKVVGAFLYSLKSFKLMNADGSFSLDRTTQAAINFCRDPLNVLHKRHSETKVHYLSLQCQTGLFMSILFTKAYRFKNDTQQIQVPEDGTKIEWPLGAVIYHYELERLVPKTDYVRNSSPSGPVNIAFTLTHLISCLIYGLVIVAISGISKVS